MLQTHMNMLILFCYENCKISSKQMLVVIVIRISFPIPAMLCLQY